MDVHNFTSLIYVNVYLKFRNQPLFPGYDPSRVRNNGTNELNDD